MRRLAGWVALVFLGGGVWLADRVAGDEVAAYLERHGLNELLAVHLEEELEAASGERRRDLLVRLAELYSELLETVSTPERREMLEERSRRLLGDAPAGSSHGLRLALLRASYRSAERIAENHRLRLADPEEVEQAIEELRELIPELTRLRRETETHLELADRRLSRSSGSAAIVQAETVDKARQLHAQATFLTAWAQYYVSWLNDRPDNARVAQQLFEELLDLDDQLPSPEDVSVDLRSTEAVARCILGYALCKSLTASGSTALRWIALLEHERTYEPLREQALAWKIAIYLEHGEYLAVQNLLDRFAADGGEIPLEWLRLVAVGAIEAEDRSSHATSLVRYAVTELATRGELDQVFDLAERYGAEAVGTSGFALRYVHGVLRYKQARDAHDGDDPTSNPGALADYAAAVEHFQAALEQRDAEHFPAASIDCDRLTAWCLFFQGELLEAREAFEKSAEALPAEQAPEALWMAIVCLDLLVEADPGSERLSDRLATTIRRFLDEYPASEHAPKLILRRALTSGEITPAAAEELLAIPPNSEVYEAARRRAAQILYRLFRDASGVQRMQYGTRFLEAALPLHEQAVETLDPADEVAVARYVVRARRLLEVALNEVVARLGAARRVLEGLDGLDDHAALEGLDAEIDYRRIQERLLSDERDEAARIADRLWEEDPAAIWTRLASRAMFKDARRRWTEAEEDGTDDRDEVAAVFKYGTRVLEESDEVASARTDRTRISYLAAVGEAAMRIWERSRDPQRGRQAFDVYRQLLDARPRNARFLRAMAILSEQMGEPETSMDCWRSLVAGSPPGGEDWYEAKFHLIQLLAARDPERARAVMTQHKLLNPEYGPDPWGTRLRALDRRLAPAPAADGGDEEPEAQP